VAAHLARHQGHHDQEHQLPHADLQAAHRGLVHLVQPAAHHQAGRNSVWASSLDWVAACPEAQDGRPTLEHGLPVAGLRRAGRHRGLDVGRAAGPFPEMGRTGYCPDAAYPGAERLAPVPQEGHRWNQDGAAAARLSHRQSGLRGLPGRGRAAPQVPERVLAVAVAAELSVVLEPLEQPPRAVLGARLLRQERLVQPWSLPAPRLYLQRLLGRLPPAPHWPSWPRPLSLLVPS